MNEEIEMQTIESLNKTLDEINLKTLIKIIEERDSLKQQLSNKEAIIKEAREYINNHDMDDGANRAELDDIFDKENQQ